MVRFSISTPRFLGSSDIQLPAQEHNIRQEPRTAIGQELKRHILRHVERTSSTTVVFNLDWEPRQFLRDSGAEPEPGASPGEVFQKVMSITGTLLKAQLMTLEDYMQQIWIDSWTDVRDIFAGLLTLSPGQKWEGHDTDTLRSGSSPLRERPSPYVEMNGQGSYSIMIPGDPDFVAKTGEQIAWLAAALHPPPASAVEHGGVFSRVASVENFRMIGETPALSCDIRFDTTRVKTHEGTQGSCWTSLFWHTVIIGGYPTLPRLNDEAGLEASLPILFELLDANAGYKIGDRVFIKGFHSLLVVSKAYSESWVWHLVSSGDPNVRVAYNDPRVDEAATQVAPSLSLRHSSPDRHYLGWCAKAADHCGVPGSNFDIESSMLGRVGGGMVFERMYMELGTYFLLGLVMRWKKTAEPFRREEFREYPDLVNWLQERTVIFYDTLSRRGWHVNGMSALLLLLRRLLFRDQRRLGSDYRFRDSDLITEWGPDATSTDAAYKTLTCWENRKLLLDHRIEDLRLEKRAMRICLDLEAITECQRAFGLGGELVVNFSRIFRNSVTGFDIRLFDPAGDKVQHPRINLLNAHGPGWSNFALSNGIPVIFGQNFGELIQPAANTSAVCQEWATVPSDLELLTTTAASMRLVQRAWNGDHSPGKCWNTRFAWVSSSPSLAPCPCVSAQNGQVVNHIDPLHYILPRGSLKAKFMARDMNSVDLDKLDPMCAIVLGHLSFRTLRDYQKDRASTTVSVTGSGASTSGVSTSGTLVEVTKEKSKPTGGEES